MAKKVTRKDVFENDIFTQVIKDAKEFDKVLKGIVKTEKQSLAETKKFLQSFSGNSFSDLQKFNKGIKEADLSIKTLNKAEKEQIRIKQRIKQLQSDQGKQNELLKLQLSEQRKAIKQTAKERLGLVSVYQKESARLNDLRKKYKDIALTQGENSKQAKRLRGEVTKLDAKLKKVDASVGQFQRNVGNYKSAFKGLGGVVRSTLSAFGFVGGIYVFANAIREAFTTIRNFQKENAVLAGVLGKTRAEIKGLTSDARRLGSITAKTSSEVTQLQIAYARLGFSQSEILDLTEGTINGSIALNAELDQTANLVGAVIRTFDDLETSDATNVVDLLSAATQKSALNFTKLETALPIVAGAANAAGIPLSSLTALLGKLSDSGIDASSSATALRNIFIESAKQGLSYEEILDKISNSTDQLTAANDEFGKRAAVSASILAKNIKETKELDLALQDVAGTSQRLADEQLDTLDGSILKLSSAYEGFILSVESGEGPISNAINSAIKGVTTLLGYITQLNKTSDEFGQQYEGSISKEVTSIIGGAKNSEEAIKSLNDALFETQIKLIKTQERLNQESGFFDFLNPAKLTKNKALEQSVGVFEKKIEILKTAISDPDAFLNNLEQATTKNDPTTPTGEPNPNIQRTDVQIENLKTRQEIAEKYREELNITIDALKQIGAISDEAAKEEEKYQEKLKKAIETNKAAEEELIRKDKERFEENKKRQQEQIQGIKNITTTTIDALNRRSEAQKTALDQEIADREQNITRQQELAAQGLDNSLAFEQQKKAQAEVERERLAEKQQRREKILAYFNLLASYAEQGNPDGAASKALAQVAIAETVAGFFAEGTESVGDNNTTKWRNTGTDDYIVAVDKGERIIAADQNKLIGDLTNKELSKLAYQYNQGLLQPKVQMINSNGEVVSQLKQVNQSLSITPSYQVNWDRQGNLIETEIRKGIKRVKRTLKGRTRI